MSANNQLRIWNRGNEWCISEDDVDTGKGILLAVKKSLEEAIKFANKYQEDNEIEYGLDVSI
jgi:hypothetical protein